MRHLCCVIVTLLVAILFTAVLSGCETISSNVGVATQPMVETSSAEYSGETQQEPMVNDAEEFILNVALQFEEESPTDYSVKKLGEILRKNADLEEYFKENVESLALYCFEYIINHENLCNVDEIQNVSFSGNDRVIALTAWELMLTYDDVDSNFITSASSLDNWLYRLNVETPTHFILAKSKIDAPYYIAHPVERQYIVAMLRNPKRIFSLTVNYLSDPELMQETNRVFYQLFSDGIMDARMVVIPENTTVEEILANCTEFSYWVIDEKDGRVTLEITTDSGNLIQITIASEPQSEE